MQSGLPETYRSFLIAEIGTALTRVTLVDGVDETYRLIARQETWSTLAAPERDVSVAIMRAVAGIEETTGRTLLLNGNLIQPMDQAGNGVHALVVTTSAGGTLPILIVALSAERSARSALHASRATYSRVLHSFALDQAGNAQGDWVNRQIVQIVKQRPEAILIAGGVEGGAVSPLQRLAEIVRVIERQHNPPPTVIFAGNTAAVEPVKNMFDAQMPLIVVDNLRPAEGRERLEPTRNVLRNLYAQQYLANLPGTSSLRQMRVTDVGSVVDDQRLATRFLAERFGRNLLTLDMGSQRASALLQSEEHYSESILGACGTQRAGLDLLKAVGAEAITRWLPFELSTDALENRLLNRRLLPAHAPADLDDLLLDHALLREGLRLAYQGLRDERPVAPLDLVVAGGAVARSPRPGMAALTLLDALELEGSQMQMAIDLYLDALSLLPIGGALARQDIDAAACLIEQDVLNNGPLATVIVPHGQLAGKVAEVELTPVGGTPTRITVEAGMLARLPLPRGRRATLRIQPTAQVAIGTNARGAEVLSNEAAIAGSALGVIIDARPRPLALPETFAERQQALLGYLRALDGLPTSNAYTQIVPFSPPPAVTTDAPVVVGEAVEPTEAVITPQPAMPASAPLDMDVPAPFPDDLAALRKDLLVEEEPKRGGFFRRKK